MIIIRQLVDKYQRASKTMKASLWFIVCYMIQRGMQFIGMPIFTRIMTADEYGMYAVFLSWFNLLCIFTSLNIYSGTFNKAMIKYEKERDSYISSIQWLTLLLGFLFSFIIIIFNESITNQTGYSIKFQILMCLHLILFPSLQYWSQKQRFLFEYKKLVFISLTNSICSLIFGVIITIISDDKSFSLIAVTVIIESFICSFLFFCNYKKQAPIFSKNYWQWSMIMALPLIPHYVSELLLGHADRIMISYICGSAKAGIYNIVYQISMVMTIIRTGINGAFAPWLYYSLKNKDYMDIRTNSKALTIMMFMLTVFFMLIGPEILRLAAPESYYEAVVGIPAIMIGCFFIYVYVLFMYVEIYLEKTKGVAVASIIAALTNILLNYIFIPKFGYLAAAYTTLISYILLAVMHYIFLRLSIGHDEKFSLVYDFKFLFITSFLIILLGGLIIYLYDFPLLRLMSLLTLIIVGYLNRTKVLHTYSQLRSKK